MFFAAIRLRTKLYLDHREVTRLKLLCATRDCIGCPVYPWSEAREQGTNKALDDVRCTLETKGIPFLQPDKIKRKKPEDILKESLIQGKEKPNWFRDRWYPERRLDILEAEGLGYLYDTFYRWFCSAVHTDIMGSEALAGLDRGSAAFLAVMLWGCALHRMTEAFNFRMPAASKNLLRNHFYGFLHWPHGSTPRTQQAIDKRREQIRKQLDSV